MNDPEIQALVADARGHLRTRTGCRSCVRGIEQLADEVTRLRAQVQRVEDLAAAWDRLSKGESMTTAAIRTALVEDQPSFVVDFAGDQEQARLLCDPMNVLPPKRSPR